ncbi:hypothetical protein JI721_02655 [Alicyclobacillus cycloheptanicus]|uniref:Sporulation membrane protein YtrI C-terminal domain-containing protein n=1 Tax=Alicyclobacillus cycloheptanicus TaxID=1457 RepID=A0ABT9XLI3_9BACL|nr:hypothetical protein [Alicyclobacillus cycloheptanicus]MDQ0190879.1 hypothetical protein [Alicyclobacillus cycloheptanicus]WDM01768.1 hypothetical protein JI721_02655 [Alicyclobacillus cycloheptanicus]
MKLQSMKLRQSFAWMVVGVLIGSSGMNLVHGRQFENLNLEIQSLRLHLEEADHENARLSAQLHQPSTEPLLQNIDVQAKAPDGLSQLQVVQFVQQQLQFLEGRRIEILIEQPELPTNLLEGRTLTVDNTTLTIHVTQTVLVGETLHLHVTATPTKS